MPHHSTRPPVTPHRNSAVRLKFAPDRPTAYRSLLIKYTMTSPTICNDSALILSMVSSFV